MRLILRFVVNLHDNVVNQECLLAVRSGGVNLHSKRRAFESEHNQVIIAKQHKIDKDRLPRSSSTRPREYPANARAHLGYGTINIRRDDDLVTVYYLVLVNDAHDIAAGDRHALLDHGAGREGPAHVAGEGRDVHPLGHVDVPAVLEDVLQGTLDAVEDRAHDARAELDGEGLLLPEDGVANGEAGGVLVDLDGGRVALELDDLADELEVADAHELVHGGSAHVVGHDQRSGDLEDEAIVRFLLVLSHL